MKALDRKTLLRIAAIPLGLFLVIQVLPVDRSNPHVESRILAPPEVVSVLEKTCFDCHSNETKWPWYSWVAPVSWIISNHVAEGRKQLNFSAWPSSNPAAQTNLYRAINREVSTQAMPLTSYVRLHPEAHLNDDDRKTLLEWSATLN